ncbi:NAD-dependent epimerase/dehydratase family protein [Paenibacillus sp. 19GGS1-52]|uniref:NAD-dependent epimerase/dehydratase family protein n=1 Tax=Paenibacillus sp. 19GGS1-52 TaxID=2758563 RepID=UPI001EFAFC8C|nr:NAD-dependent epimerase/dehydratase family protein [Paenibacillus sp. 19GGS1-52]ULO04965.1 NAD-dependent epimerase/dehydratase family protein [Paenibacillus sp. 19GGS1-52]
MKIRAIITGATGMVGEGVLHECLQHPDVEQVLVINRKPCGVIHPKLTEIIHKDFLDLSEIKSQLSNYNACYFCLGVTSVGLKEEEYSRLSYDLTLHMAEMLASLNPDMVFCYVSGMGTDSTEKGKRMWARVKGKTENHLLALPFKKAYMFRPAYIHPTKGLKNTNKMYFALLWLYPILRRLFPKVTVSLKEIGLAMIHTVTLGYEKSILESKDIIELAKSH